MAKKPPSTIPKKPKAYKAGRYYEVYSEYFLYRKKPAPEAFLERVADDLIRWIHEHPKSVRLDDFFSEKGIHWERYSKWTKKNESLKDAIDIAMQIIASRRDTGAIEKRYDGNYIAKTIRMYCPVAEASSKRELKEKYDKEKELVRLRAQLNLDEKGDKHQVVIIERFPNSDLVPEREEVTDKEEVTLQNDHVCRKSTLQKEHGCGKGINLLNKDL